MVKKYYNVKRKVYALARKKGQAYTKTRFDLMVVIWEPRFTQLRIQHVDFI